MSHINAVGNALLETKLFKPEWHTRMVSRPRLVGRLQESLERKVTLVSAPAGFGKTTLLAEWITHVDHSGQDIAWFSIDLGDNDPTLFWSYFVIALQSLNSQIGQGTLPLLYAPQAPPITSTLATLINEISAMEKDFALVLDDYHLIESEEIHSALAFLIDRLPPRMHLVIASRVDLPFQTARLRMRGELAELRIDELQFTNGEAHTFFKQSMGLELTDHEVMSLENQTEGWVAGLQLAALSLQGRQDVRSFVEAFGGDDRYVADFLVEEVLEQQPGNIRRFLLHTSILSRLSGSLCDRILDQKGCQEILLTLEKANLFVVPLDDKRHWYRYHHLFGDTLHEILVREQAEHVAVLHERASAWYEENGLYNEAVRHAMAAGNSERVAGLVELVADTMFSTGQITTLYEWVDGIPEELVVRRPVVSFWLAWANLDRGNFDLANRYCELTQKILEENEVSRVDPDRPGGQMVVTDHQQFPLIPGRLANVQAICAQVSGDIAGMVHHAKRALELLPKEDYLWRGGTTVILGFNSWANGDLEIAHQVIAEGFAVVEKTGEVHYQISGSYLMADIRVSQGRLNEAMALHKRMERLALKQPGPVIKGTADIYVCMSEIELEQGNKDLALQHFEKGKELGEPATNFEFRSRWRSVAARFKEVEGDYNAALDLLDEAEQLYVLGPIPNWRPLAARKARIWIAQERLSEVFAWVKMQGLSVDDELSYLREYEHITLARALIAQYRVNQDADALNQASRFLKSLERASEEGGRVGSLIEILILQAITDQLSSNAPAALMRLKRAVSLAEPESYVQVFIDEGHALHDLFKMLIEENTGGDFARRLYAALLKSSDTIEKVHRGGGILIEPLSNREIEVLRLIVAGMRNQEIADQLYISLATVKRHISNVYGKLEVTHRTEAVAKANALNLL